MEYIFYYYMVNWRFKDQRGKSQSAVSHDGIVSQTHREGYNRRTLPQTQGTEMNKLGTCINTNETGTWYLRERVRKIRLLVVLVATNSRDPIVGLRRDNLSAEWAGASYPNQELWLSLPNVSVKYPYFNFPFINF